MRPPEFWQRGRGGAAAAVLAPLGSLYALGGRLRRTRATPYRAPVPVVCVGNLTVGGAGKTPVAMAVAERLAAAGVDVHFVTRGYGGRITGPVRVDPQIHSAADVGDEPLLLARRRTAWVARRRPEGIAAAAAAGADAVVLDDGYQNPTFAKDVALVVVDGTRGFGNGHVLPAGPLREPVADGLARASAVVIMGDDHADIASSAAPLPVIGARVVPAPGAEVVRGRRVFAFAGIAHPDKVWTTLRGLDADLAGTRAFPDHHLFTPDEIAAMLAEAERAGALVVTTEKDAVRLRADLAGRVTVLPVIVAWSNPSLLDRVLAPVIF